jgi:hypothetical protein
VLEVDVGLLPRRVGDALSPRVQAVAVVAPAAQADVAVVRRGDARPLAVVVGVRDHERGVSLPEHVEDLVVEPRGVPELEVHAPTVGSRFQEGRQLEEHRVGPDAHGHPTMP